MPSTLAGAGCTSPRPIPGSASALAGESQAGSASCLPGQSFGRKSSAPGRHCGSGGHMQSRSFGRSGRNVGEIGFGAWAIGAAWGKVDDTESVAALHAALDAGLDFIDTADVYGDGHSERLIAQVLKARGGERP